MDIFQKQIFKAESTDESADESVARMIFVITLNTLIFTSEQREGLAVNPGNRELHRSLY